jgi:predicted porin
MIIELGDRRKWTRPISVVFQYDFKKRLSSYVSYARKLRSLLTRHRCRELTNKFVMLMLS